MAARTDLTGVIQSFNQELVSKWLHDTSSKKSCPLEPSVA
jgi:hypothetical protein